MTNSSSPLGLSFLGAPRISINGQFVHINRRKAVALLAYLAVTGKRHRRETLAALFWPQLDEKRTRANLRYTLWTLKQSLGTEWLETDGQTMKLRSGFVLDTQHFSQNIAAAQSMVNKGENPNLALLGETVQLYRDAFLAGFTLRDAPGFDEWQFFQTQRFGEKLALVLQWLIDGFSRQKQWSDAITYAQRWLALDPLNEQAHMRLMQLYALMGQKAAALRQYKICWQQLETELGVAPQVETTALYEAIRNTTNGITVIERPLPEVTSSQHHTTALEPTTTFADLPLDTIPEPGALPSGSHVPLRTTPLFVGRKEDLCRLACELKNGATVAAGQSVAVTGLGGLGKTQLVIEFAYRYGRYFPGGVFWLNCQELEAIPDQITRLGGTCHMALHPDFAEFKQAKQVALVQQAWQEAIPRLLIFDACEEEEVLTRWQPKGGGSCVLITSRRGRWSLTLGVAKLALDVLPRAESVQLLHQFQEALAPKLAADIAAELGDLPLALHLAGSFLRTYRHEVTPAAYLAELRGRQGQKLLEHPSLKGRGANASPTKHELHVAQTFALSYKQMNPTQELDSLAQALLARAACFAPGEPIPRDLLMAAALDMLADYAENEQALWLADGLTRLVSLGLISEHLDGTIRLHQLIAEFVRGIIPVAVAQMAVEEAIIAEAERLNKGQNSTSLHAWQVHLHYVTELAQPRKDLHAGKLSHELGIYLMSNSAYHEAKPALARALLVYKRVLGSEHPDTASCLNTLGCIQKSIGEYQDAQYSYEQALAIREKVLGPNHPDTADSLLNLGLLFYMLGEYEVAWTHVKRVFVIREKVLGSEHPETARSLNCLSMLLQAMGDYEGAYSYIKQALMIQERVLGSNHFQTASSLNNLGMLLHVMGKYATAYSYYEQSLAICEKLKSPERMATVLINLSELLPNMGENEVAQRYAERALAFFEKTMGPMHQSVAYPLHSLGLIYLNTDSTDAARTCLVRALAIRENTLGPDHPLTAQSLVQWGRLLQKTGDMAGARTHYERALAIQGQTLAADHLDIAATLNRLGILLQDMGHSDKAGACLERALVIRESKFGEDHPDTAETRRSLNTLHQSLEIMSSSQLRISGNGRDAHI